MTIATPAGHHDGERLENELRRLAAFQAARRTPRISKGSADRSGQRSKSGSRRCNKVRYRDHDQAIGALHVLYATSTRAKTVVRAYQCTRCNEGWHLTSEHDVVSAERRPTCGARRAVPGPHVRRATAPAATAAPLEVLAASTAWTATIYERGTQK